MLIAINEAAEMLGVHEDTLRHWDRHGKLRAVRTPGGHRRWRLDDIHAIIDGEYKVPGRRKKRK